MKSKGTIRYILAFLITLFFIGSSMAQTLILSNSSLQVAAADSSNATFNITSDSYWGIYNVPSWITVDTTWGDSNRIMNISASQNPFTIARTDTMTVYWLKDWVYYSDTKLSVTQASSTFGVSDTAITIGASNGSIASFFIASNMYWEISDLPTWLTVDNNWQQTSKTITLTATTNPQCIARTGTFTVKRLLPDSTYLTATVNVTQSPSIIGVSTQSITIADTAGSKGKFWVNAIGSWSVSGVKSWVTVNKTASSGTDTITVTALANTTAYYRVDTLTITLHDGETYSVAIIQNAVSVVFSVSPTSFSFDDSVNISIPVTIRSNTNWGVVSFPSWIENSEIIGYGDSTFSLIAQQNTDTISRSGSFIVYWFDFSNIYHKLTINVLQTGVPVLKSLDSVSVNTLVIADTTGSNAKCWITSRGAWTVSGFGSWLSLNKTSSTGTDTLIFTAQANTSGNYRTDTLTISFYDGKTYSLIVIQTVEAAFSFLPNSFVFDNFLYSSIPVTVTSNTNWGFIAMPSWLTNSQIIGYGDSTFTITAQKNTTGATLTDSFTAYWFDFSNVYHENTISVTQMPEGVKASSLLITTDAEPLIYPNPAKDIISINLASNTIRSVIIYSIEGNRIATITSDFNAIPISQLPAGIYAVVIETQNNTFIQQRIIKQ